MFVAGPGVCVRVACPDTGGCTDVSVAVIVAVPAVVELVSVAVYVPSRLRVVGLNLMPLSLEEKATVWPTTGNPLSLTAAVAVLVDVPSATVLLGDSFTVIVSAAPAASAPAPSTDALKAADTTAMSMNRGTGAH